MFHGSRRPTLYLMLFERFLRELGRKTLSSYPLKEARPESENQRPSERSGIVNSGQRLRQPSDLRQQVAKPAAAARGRVAVACSLPGTSLNCDFNPTSKP